MSTKARFFADFREENDDVNEYPSEPFSVKLKHTSAGGLKVSSTTRSCLRKDGEKVEVLPLIASVKPSFLLKDYDTALKFGLHQKIRQEKTVSLLGGFAGSI